MKNKLRRFFMLVGLLFIVFGLDYYLLSLARVSRPPLPNDGLAFQLMTHVKTLAQPAWAGRKPGTEGNRLATDYIEEKFKICGVRSFESLSGYKQLLANSLGHNVVGFKSAKTKSNRWIVVGAHFDHVGHEGFFNRVHLGADDNASSVAILIETACSVPYLESTNIAFVAYNTEEPPYFLSSDMGSTIFIDNLPAEIKGDSQIIMSITMDLMGGAHWKPMLNSLIVVGGSTSEGLYNLVSNSKVPDLNVLQMDYHAVERLPYGERSAVSDYAPYLAKNIPSLFLTLGRTPRYHEPDDTYETLDYDGMSKRTHWLTTFIPTLDSYNAKFTSADAMQVEREATALAPYVKAAYRWSSRIPGTSLFTLQKFRSDHSRLSEAMNPTERRILIEKIVQRFQCSMMNLPICFLLD